jgi:alkylation response protein AidB-like acyl-CoA dehydrogenase
LSGVIERDEFRNFQQSKLRKMAELGFMGMMVDPKYGGSGLTAFYVLAITEISKIDASACYYVCEQFISLRWIRKIL